MRTRRKAADTQASRHEQDVRGKQGDKNMAIFLVALIMTAAMMGAAFYALYREQRGAMYRSLRAAGRGQFPEAISDRS